MIPSLR